MTNSCSLTKAGVLLWVSVACFVGVSAMIAWQDGGIQMILLSLLGFLPLGAAIWFLGRGRLQVARVSALCSMVANGELEQRLCPVRDGGTLSELQHNVNEMLDIVDAYVRESEASLQHVRDGKYHRRILLRGMVGGFRRSSEAINQAVEAMGMRDAQVTQLADSFDDSVKTAVEVVAAAATEMSATAQAMSGTTDITHIRVRDMGAASDTSSANVETVAAAAEELASSVAEIGRQVSNSARVTDKAFDSAIDTNRKIKGLEAAAARIGEVLSLISDIAAQTNLLALNATIEAARAGSAGKGFTVVASEVKNLATQTAKATEDIADQIQGIQQATSDAVIGIQEIGDVIGEMRDIAGSIDESVSQQNLAINEIAYSIQQAAQATRGVANDISTVGQATEETGRAVADVQQTANELAQQAERLRGGVVEFFDTLRAA